MKNQEVLGSQDQMNLKDGMKAERNGTELIGSNGTSEVTCPRSTASAPHPGVSVKGKKQEKRILNT